MVSSTTWPFLNVSRPDIQPTRPGRSFFFIVYERIYRSFWINFMKAFEHLFRAALTHKPIMNKCNPRLRRASHLLRPPEVAKTLNIPFKKGIAMLNLDNMQLSFSADGM